MDARKFGLPAAKAVPPFPGDARVPSSSWAPLRAPLEPHSRPRSAVAAPSFARAASPQPPPTTAPTPAAAFADAASHGCPLRAWGSRRLTPAQAAAAAVPAYGRVNPRCLRAAAALPVTAHDVDATVRAPLRACGGWTLGPAYHRSFHFYRTFGNASRGAFSAGLHNFPGGRVPEPERLYSAEACGTLCTKVRNPRPRAKVSVGVNTVV